MRLLRGFKFLLLLIFLSIFSPAFANNAFHGYVTNKIYKPLKLKVFEIGKEFLYLDERNLEDNSFVPHLNLRITAENVLDYSIVSDENNIFIPESTKLVGYISEIEPPKSFNRKGIYKVAFDKAVCPDGKEIYLKNNIISQSQKNIYNPLQHLGKTTLSFVGGSLAGALFSYQLGGLGLALATHGYSLAAGAAAGGFIGTVGGVVSSGKKASIEPGSQLTIIPVDDVSLNDLKQIICMKPEVTQENMTDQANSDKKISLEILSVKEKKDMLGDSVLKIKIRFTNNSNEVYRLSNFFLRDSQGNEYTATIINLKEDIFINFQPKQATIANLEFFVDHPKASHWLVLKDKYFTNEVGKWKIENGT